jgi:pyruvate/2-oxoglutarate dehydrogenase complex dihydrolipoamide acyltransferase (E2) component
MKTTVYASTQSPQITKGIYLRAHQILILRVEARSPNDDPGTYHIHLGGTFEPFSGGIPVAENIEPAENSTKASSNRLSSVGATIPRPPAEVTETAEKTPSETEAPKKETEKPASPAAARRTTARGPRRGARPAPARKPPAEKKTESTAKTETETPKTEPAKTETPKEEKSAPAEKPVETTAPVEKPKPQELSPTPVGARLIVEEKDGTRIERPMSTVRRVVVEGPTIVIVLKTGKIERINMSAVSRMAIEPQ